MFSFDSDGSSQTVRLSPRRDEQTCDPLLQAALDAVATGLSGTGYWIPESVRRRVAETVLGAVGAVSGPRACSCGCEGCSYHREEPERVTYGPCAQHPDAPVIGGVCGACTYIGPMLAVGDGGAL